MHLFWCADDGIHRASLYAQRAAYAYSVIDHGNGARVLRSVGGIERDDGQLQQTGQAHDALLSAGRALVKGCLAGSDRLSIGATGRIAAFGALRLRQKVFDLVG